ncbi:MAG: type II toxin-antitoxin system RelB/DinJ family antitoxin [Defluviitaleaceae bacterium]|nr:type II toxin-antitoxin system RelB/DinJ family antitoxin [Defluviitaleaceae bacterium]
MAEIALNIMMDAEKVQSVEKVCDDIGMSLHEMFEIFVDRVIEQKQVPFAIPVESDPFFSEANLAELRKAIADVNSGKEKLIIRELIEVEDD